MPTLLLHPQGGILDMEIDILRAIEIDALADRHLQPQVGVLAIEAAVALVISAIALKRFAPYDRRARMEAVDIALDGGRLAETVDSHGSRSRDKAQQYILLHRLQRTRRIGG